jgi:hypothetical protein
VKGLTADVDGFNVHAGVRVAAGAVESRERLLRYCARSPLSLERLSLLEDGRIAYRVQHGNAVRIMTPMQFMARLAALIPPPRHPLIRFHGVFAPHSKLRPRVVPGRSSECHPMCGHAHREPAAAGVEESGKLTKRPANEARSGEGATRLPATSDAHEPVVVVPIDNDAETFTAVSEVRGRLRFVEVFEDRALASVYDRVSTRVGERQVALRWRSSRAKKSEYRGGRATGFARRNRCRASWSWISSRSTKSNSSPTRAAARTANWTEHKWFKPNLLVKPKM